MKLYKIKKSDIDKRGRGLYATRDIKGGTKISPKKNCVIGFGITEKTISKFKNTDGLVVGSQICKEITRSLNNRQNPVINVSKMVSKLRKKIS